MEKLHCDNIIEISYIRRLLQDHQKLLNFFNDILKVVDQKLNQEAPCVSLPIEANTEPDLSDHSSDDD
jgi:hypothetical protein